MYLKPLILAIIILIITIYTQVKRFKKNGFSSIRSLIGIELALMCLAYPLYNNYDILSRIIYSILYALQTLLLSENFELVNSLVIKSVIDYVYVIIIYALFLIAPLLTATTLLTLLGSTFSKLKLRFSLKKEYHIFSQINRKTTALAEKILATNDQAKIIFTNNSQNEGLLATNIKFLTLPGTINQLNIASIKKVKYLYYMSENEDDNLSNALEFIDSYNAKDKINLYILNSKQEAYMIVDSLVKQKDITNIKVEIINEVERTVYQRLKDLPIPQIFMKDQKTVTALIVGCGEYGQAFLKGIAWCFQVIGYNLKIVVVEKNSDESIRKTELEAPELLDRYDITFINKEIETVINDNDLQNYNINYVVVTAGSDSNNFNIAIALRRYFMYNQLKLNTSNPIIDVLIRDEFKSKNIDILKSEKDEAYNLNTFGSIIDQYKDHPIIDSDIEKMAENVHLVYNPNDTELSDFNKSEYNKKSSRATAVHVRYKLLSLLGDNYTNDLEKDIEQYKKLILNDEAKKALAINEHNRWMAYLYTDGYRLSDMNMVRQYYNRTNKNHKDTLIRLHPALISFEYLNDVEINLENLNYDFTGVHKKVNLLKYDFDITQALDKIVKL